MLNLGLMFNADYDGKWEKKLRVKQFYMEKDISSNLLLMAGRTILRWGTGYAFNPTDVVAPEKELSDPDNEENRASGNDMIKIEYFGLDYSIALCYITNLKTEKRIAFSGSKFAVRFYKNIWDIDLSLICLMNKDEKPVYGVNFSYVLNDRLEIHGEASMQKGSYRKYHDVLIKGDVLFDYYPFSYSRRERDRYYNRILLGFQYTFEKNILWIFEYYHQDQGYSKSEWQKIINYTKFLNNQLNTPYGESAAGNLFRSLNVFTPKGAMRDYLMNYINLPLSDNIEMRVIYMMNLTDLSFINIPSVNYRFKNYFIFYLRSFIFKGEAGSEYEEFLNSFTIEGGIRFRI